MTSDPIDANTPPLPDYHHGQALQGYEPGPYVPPAPGDYVPVYAPPQSGHVPYGYPQQPPPRRWGNGRIGVILAVGVIFAAGVVGAVKAVLHDTSSRSEARLCHEVLAGARATAAQSGVTDVAVSAGGTLPPGVPPPPSGHDAVCTLTMQSATATLPAYMAIYAGSGTTLEDVYAPQLHDAGYTDIPIADSQAANRITAQFASADDRHLVIFLITSGGTAMMELDRPTVGGGACPSADSHSWQLSP